MIFEIDAPMVSYDATEALAHDAEGEADSVVVGEGHSLWTARVDPHSKARAGSKITMAVDTSALHFFHPATGLAIGRN